MTDDSQTPKRKRGRPPKATFTCSRCNDSAVPKTRWRESAQCCEACWAKLDENTRRNAHYGLRDKNMVLKRHYENESELVEITNSGRYARVEDFRKDREVAQKVNDYFERFAKAHPSCQCCRAFENIEQDERGAWWCPLCAYGVLRCGMCAYHRVIHYPDIASTMKPVEESEIPRELLPIAALSG